MPKLKKPSQRSQRARLDREVILAVVPYKPNCSRMGVAIKSHGKQTVLAPDEARALARTEDDPFVKRQLEMFAAFIDNPPENLTARFPGEVEVVPPAITGPDALKLWVESYHFHWQSAYLTS